MKQQSEKSHFMSHPHEILDDVTGLISLPDVYLRIRDLLDDPKANLGDFANVVAMDPNISTRVLRMANSPFFGFAAKIESLSRAINIMGVAQLHDLVLGISAVNSFASIPNDVMDMSIFWRRSVLCGISARLLASQCNVLDAQRLFVAGLLHDIGHLILYNKRPDLSKQAIQQSSEQAKPLFLIERFLMGYDYGQVGSELMANWNLPESYQETTALHMEPSKAQHFQLEAAIVHMGRQIAHSMIKAVELNGTESADPSVWEITGLTEEVIGPVAQQAKKHMADVIHLIQPG